MTRHDDDTTIRDWYERRGGRRTRAGRTGDLCDLVSRMGEGTAEEMGIRVWRVLR